jgi:hypothetical protein
MRNTIVFIFLICAAFGEWQQTEEVALPRGIQVNDLAISSSGELYILSTSSILKYEAESKSPFFVQGIADGKLLAVDDGIAYILNTSNRLYRLNLNTQGFAPVSDFAFNTPTQMCALTLDSRSIVVLNEAGALALISEGEQIGVLNTRAERFAMIPNGDYTQRQTPLYTLEKNQIYQWAGGTIDNVQSYAKKIIYSASNAIVDLTASRNGNVYVLFSDSIVVLESDGTYQGRISIDNVSPGSRIESSPNSNNIYVFDYVDTSIKTFAGTGKSSTNIITLYANQPNPVDNYTEISFAIDQDLDVTITIYNLIGEPVKVITRERYLKGTHSVTWHADDNDGNLVPNGIYFYRLESSKGVAIKQLIVLR